jgi:hypothetical protein
MKNAINNMIATGLAAFTANSKIPQRTPAGIQIMSLAADGKPSSQTRDIKTKKSKIPQVYKGSDITMELYIILEGHRLHASRAKTADLYLNQRRQRM